jgi:hypothetical protein
VEQVLLSDTLYPQIRRLIIDLLRSEAVEREVREALLSFFGSEGFKTLLVNKTAGLMGHESSQQAVI